MARLLLRKRAGILKEIDIGSKKEITCGSYKENDVVIDDKTVSEHHCTISFKNGKIELKDNNTLSGTKVNGRAVSQGEIKFGDIIGIGTHSVVLREDAVKRAKGQKTDRKAWLLLGIYGKFEGKKFEITQGDTFIGREEFNTKGIANDVVLLGDMTASKGHAKINCSGTKCMLTDIGSTGGVAVNNKKVGQLNDIGIALGDEIAIGRTIFRFTDENNIDYSLPKHFNAFFAKLIKKVKFFGSLAVICGAVYFIFQAINSINIISARPPKPDFDFDRQWSVTGNVTRQAPNDYDISSSVAVADIKNDGNNYIVYQNSSGSLFAWDGREGRKLWQVDIQAPGKASPCIADMNNDGINDIVTVSGNSILYVIDGQSGKVIFKDMLGGTVGDISPCVGDLNLDGKKDIVMCSEEGSVYFIYAPGIDADMQKFVESVEMPIYASPIIVSSKRILPLAVISSYNSKVYMFEGKSREKKTVDLVEATGKAHLIESAPAAGDINGDGVPEIVVQTSIPQYVSAININDFNVAWTYFIDPVPPPGLKHTSSPVILDIDGDGMNDVVALSANSNVYGLRGKTGFVAGELLWRAEIPEKQRVISSPALVDFNKDGVMDIVFGTESGSIYALDCSLRARGDIIAVARASNNAITSTPIVADVNSDGKLEIVYSDNSDFIGLLKTNVRSFTNGLYWPVFLGNAERSGFVEKMTVGRYTQMLLIGIGVMIAVIILNIILKMKEKSKRPKLIYL